MTLTLPMLALAAVMAMSGGGQEQQPLRGEALLADLFDRVIAQYRERNIEPVEEFTADYSLAQRGIETTVFPVKGGRYSIIALCDEGCSDVDLRVGTPAGETLGEDVLEDDAPLVKLDLQPGQYRFAVAMKKCASDACLTRVKAYRIGDIPTVAPGA